jgi:hypothetical protein
VRREVNLLPVKVYITIDTEEDQWGYCVPAETSVDNVAMIPMLQKLFDRYGALPTYLVNYPAVSNEASLRVIREILDSGRCGIGAHCHPWNTPPLREEPTSFNSMLCNLPEELIGEKLQTVHRAVIDAFGTVPISFRAGRWGFGEAVARCIHDLGYRIDTSVTPFTDWTDCGGPDFTRAPTDRYCFRPDNILAPDPDGGLLEVPPTVGFLQSDFRRCFAFRKRIASSPFLKYRLLGVLDTLRLLNFRWLSPEMCTGADMVALAKTFIRRGCTFLNMTFHSTSIVPGLGPFVRTKDDLVRFLESIEVFLRFARDTGCRFALLDEAFQAESKERCLPLAASEI